MTKKQVYAALHCDRCRIVIGLGAGGPGNGPERALEDAVRQTGGRILVRSLVRYVPVTASQARELATPGRSLPVLL